MIAPHCGAGACPASDHRPRAASNGSLHAGISRCPALAGSGAIEHQLGKPLVCFGMPGLAPDLRLARHKNGIQANRFVRDHGLRLQPLPYAVHNPMPCKAARQMEVELAIGLREAGQGAWQA